MTVTDGAAPGIRLLAGRYQIGELLGRGGMADVHLGLDARLNRKVAVKLLKPSLANDPAFRTRFRQEAQAAARMAHPTIVRVFDAGEETVREPSGVEVQVPFIVMEHVDGKLLKDLVAQGPLEATEAVRIVDGILTALEYSHRAGVVHRDIKPGNVMITSSGQVKVMDFGIARAISDSSATIAQTSAILGTAHYFSPEQARGEGVDARTDLYSTGVVLYELLTGKPPFHGDTAVAVAYQHISETPVPPSALNPAISPALNAVVMHALAKDRGDRFQTAAEFRADLDIAMTGKVPDRSPVADDFNAALFGVNPNSTAASEATLRRLADDTDRTPRSQNRPPVAWIWGGVSVMAVIIIATLFWVFSLAPQQLVGANAAVAVPDVVGQSYKVGGQKLLDEKLKVARLDQPSDTVPAGQILATDPTAGTLVSPGLEVQVTVSSGPQQISLPGLIYKSEADAIAAIKAAGLVYGSTTQDFSATVPAGQVIGALVPGSQTANGGTVQVVKGGTVNLSVSNGMVQVPDVRGQDVAAARDLLAGGTMGLTVKLHPDSSCTGQKVTAQSVVGNAPQKSAITLTYCAG
ncbi:Stk1 family PASTA domain-containing Ser/Thr kinase [Lysinimonas soli]|uniref:non-specific serine/threonine protein kinase n=1 Tax=Lysinimonas soli TaxID=1074233 RepID=A0ABW0NNZ4_9MICO